MLENKVAIVTGGTRGIGYAIVENFLKNGAKVALFGSKEESVTKAVNKLKEKNPNYEVIGYFPNLTNEEEIKQTFEEIKNKYGKIDILVNNAGVQYQQKKLDDISNEQFDFTLKSNIYSMFYLTKAALPYMESGSIINTTSITTFYGEPELIDYVTSKGAIVGFTRALSTNLATKGIRVNAISPGVFWTPLQPACWEPNKIPTLGSDSDMKRMANPYEIAPAYVYLASDDSSYTTGQVIHVNGGQFKG